MTHMMRHTMKQAGAIVLMMTIAACFMGAIGAEAACGGSQRERTLRATFDIADAASAHLVSYSKAQEARLVTIATSEAAGQAALAAWRKRVDHAERTIAGVYRLVAAASLVNDDRSISVLLEAAKILGDELRELGVAR